MLGHSPSNYHVEYMDVTQHWSPDSERYGGGDCLITMMLRGWELDRKVLMEYKWFGGNRRVRIYHCTLTRAGDRIVLPVVHNPYVNRLIRTMQLTVEPYETGKLGRPQTA